jgi:hypothetical protein
VLYSYSLEIPRNFPRKITSLGKIVRKTGSRCSVFFVGDKFTAVNTSVEVRAGQSMEFVCPDMYYVTNQVCHQSGVSPNRCVTNQVCHQSGVSPIRCVTNHVCHQSGVSPFENKTTFKYGGAGGLLLRMMKKFSKHLFQ